MTKNFAVGVAVAGGFPLGPENWPNRRSGCRSSDVRSQAESETPQATLDLRRRLGDNTPTSTTPQALYHWTLADQFEDLESKDGGSRPGSRGGNSRSTPLAGPKCERMMLVRFRPNSACVRPHRAGSAAPPLPPPVRAAES